MKKKKRRFANGLVRRAKWLTEEYSGKTRAGQYVHKITVKPTKAVTDLSGTGNVDRGHYR